MRKIVMNDDRHMYAYYFTHSTKWIVKKMI